MPQRLSTDKNGGMPLMEALSKRHSMRDFAREELPLPLLSSMLWAAFGVNRAAAPAEWRQLGTT